MSERSIWIRLRFLPKPMGEFHAGNCEGEIPIDLKGSFRPDAKEIARSPIVLFAIDRSSHQIPIQFGSLERLPFNA